MTVPTAHFTKPALPPAALLVHLQAKGLVVPHEGCVAGAPSAAEAV